jgi:hypothetical protein
MTEPPIIPARKALGDVFNAIASVCAVETTARRLPMKESIETTERAEELLRDECAAGALALIVIDPRTGVRHKLPAAYWKQPGSRFTFHRKRFTISDLDERDPLYPVLRPYDGWPIGFIEPEFEVWLTSARENREAGSDTRSQEQERASPLERLNYRDHLMKFATPKLLGALDDYALERRFRRACQRAPEPIKLPGRRYIRKQIEKIRSQRVRAPSQSGDEGAR